MSIRSAPLAVLAALAPAALAAQLSTPLDSATLAAFEWRAIGPANMAGRVTDVDVDPKNPKVFYVATAAGGIWKTINAGTTFFPLFDREKIISLGDIAVAPSDPNVIYAGTGEEDSRNSISPGGGVYKSTDAGKTWKLVGLKETEAIGRIVVHPTDPNTAYVAALGHIWNANRERGLYKTTDGGATWQNVKFISDKAGFVDVAMHPTDPNTLWAASWERVRGPYFLKSGGPGSALWKTTDAGKSWTEVKGGGFPPMMKGRIGLAVAPSDPRVLYALVEADTNPNPKRGPKQVAEVGDPVIGLGGTVPRAKTNSGLYRSGDGGATWSLMYKNEDDARPFYYSQVRVDPQNPQRVYWMSSVFRFSDDGGKTVRRGALQIHTDWHAMWINPRDPEHFIIGNDGGIAVTHDKGGTYDFPATFPIGQFYAISYDMQVPYRVCGGLQDNGSWCGPSRTRGRLGASNADWFNVGGGDGFYTAQDPNDPNLIYAESQGGNISRLDISTNLRTIINRGGGRNRRSAFEDSLIIARGDTANPETPEISRSVAAVRQKARVDSLSRLRFNWETPFFLSPHAATTVYAAGNKVIKSTDRGDHFFPISPDLSTKDSLKIRTSVSQTGGITPDNTGAEMHGTVTTLAESPVRPGILYAGTDDGNVWVTRNDGGSWENLTGRFPGVPKNTWVSRVEPSSVDTAVVYVAFDGHRTNDFAPYIYMSADFGRSFKRITSGIPNDGGPNFVHVVRESPNNKHLLFAGTDLGVYVSTDRGARWQKFMAGLPTVPVFDLKIHPRDRELIAGTHGRSIWIADIAALEQMSDSMMRRPVAVFAPRPGYQYGIAQVQSWEGNKLFRAENPPFGTTIAYRVAGTPAAGGAVRAEAAPDGEGGARPAAPAATAAAAPRAAADSARIVITDVKGDTVRVLRGPAGPGMHSVTWDLRGTPAKLGPAALRDSVRTAERTRREADSTKKANPAADSSAAAGAGRRGANEPNLRPAEQRLGGALPENPFRGRRQGPLVPQGAYLVTVTVNGQTSRHVVPVERVTPISEPDFGVEQ
jgi:photosystem II stability/assembly factor-like uncharacterized protein